MEDYKEIVFRLQRPLDCRIAFEKWYQEHKFISPLSKQAGEVFYEVDKVWEIDGFEYVLIIIYFTRYKLNDSAM